jgi:glutamate-1-semialdehyde 2,1-aminomutase
MTQVFTPDVADALTARGDRLCERLNALAAEHRAPLVFTGCGSLMTGHFTHGPVRTPAQAAVSHQGLKELFFFDMLERGFYLARRGMIALSLELTDTELDAFVEAVAEFLTVRAPLLRLVH